MKRLLFVSDKFPPHIGGMETHAHEFVEYFRGHSQFKLDALSFTHDDTPDGLGVPRELVERIAAENGIHYQLPYRSIHEVDPLNEWLRERPADILFFNSLYWVRIWETLKKDHPQMKLIMRSGGNDIQQSKIVGQGATVTERREYVCERVNKYLDHLVITTNYVRDRFREIGVRNEIMESFVGGVDADRFHPVDPEEKQRLRGALDLPTDGRIVLCSGRFIPFKGIDLALNTIKKVVEDSEEKIYLLLIGGGPLQGEIHDLVETLRIQDRVIFREFIPVNEIQLFYQASDMYLQLSTVVEQQEEGGSFMATEQMGRSYIEAQATGLPVVASRVGGIPEVVTHGVSGFLVEDRDVMGAAERVKQILTDRDLFNRFSRQGRQIGMEKFDWKVLFQGYEDRLLS